MSGQANHPFRNILDSISNEYEVLLESKTKLEADCQKLNDFIEGQIQQIQQLNLDFQKLKQEFAMRQEAFSPKQMIPPPQSMLPPVPPIPQSMEDTTQIQQQHQQMPPPQQTPPQQGEPMEQNWEVILLQPNLPYQTDQISLLAEIVDISVICSTAFSPNNALLAIGSNKTLRVYNINDDQFLLEYVIDGPEDTPNHIRTLSWMPDSRYILTGGEDHNIRVFDTKPYQNSESPLIATFEAGDGEVFQLQCASNGKFFVAVTGDGVLTLWDISQDPTKPYTKLWQVMREANKKTIATSLSLSSNDRFVAVGYDDNYVAIWDLETRTCVFSSETHSKGVYAVKFIPGDQKLATASLDCTVKLWNVHYTEKGIELELWRTLTGHTNFALCLAADPTGKWLLSGSKDLHAILTSLEKGEMIFTVKSHSNSIITVSFSNSGTMFATGSGDRSIKIWQFSPVSE